MRRYIGTKIVNGTPMNLADYNTFRGWVLPADENGADEGYLVEYLDGGKPNTPHYAGYVSWSPKEQFEKAYNPSNGLSFGLALDAIENGHRVAREGWNGKDMFIVFMPRLQLPAYNTQGTDRKVNDRTAKWIGEDQSLDCQPYVAMWTAQKQWQPGWQASQADMFAKDWRIVD